jgi:hypothetical protein
VIPERGSSRENFPVNRENFLVQRIDFAPSRLLRNDEERTGRREDGKMLVEKPHKILPVFPPSCPSLPLINACY